MKRIFTILLSSAISLSMMSLLAQNPVKLWQNGPATDNGHDNEATITVFHPADSINTGMAVVVCPGGGYTHLAMDHEGMQVAKWLADNGITGVVLKYRLPHGNYTIPAEDAREALRTVRRNADKWKVNPAKVGIAGSSAGGHLASTVSTHITDAESRPDFSILFYPVVTSESGITHQGSIDNLLGDKSKDAALKENKIPASMYIFPEGGHGWGFRPTFKYHEVVKTLLHEWLKDRNKTTEEAKK